MNLRAVAAGVALAMLTACQSPRFNDTDAAFVHHMVPHHELGVRMVDAALKNADDVRVRELAFTMGGYQTSDLFDLRAWRKAWAVPKHSSAIGMLTTDEEAELGAAAGAEFDELWLTQMIRHHEGAVSVAGAELDTGQHARAKATAKRIVKVQSREITDMRELLDLLSRE